MPGHTSSADAAARGRALLASGLGRTDCHQFHDEGELGSAPDLTGYGSREWLAAMIADPQRERFYGDRNDRMPSFAKPSLSPDRRLLNSRELELLVDWLRGEWYESESAPQPGPGLAARK